MQGKWQTITLDDVYRVLPCSHALQVCGLADEVSSVEGSDYTDTSFVLSWVLLSANLIEQSPRPPLSAHSPSINSGVKIHPLPPKILEGRVSRTPYFTVPQNNNKGVNLRHGHLADLLRRPVRCP